ncbi:MAG: ABC transporter ATP-binding protein [Actinomycetota bacterium]
MTGESRAADATSGATAAAGGAPEGRTSEGGTSEGGTSDGRTSEGREAGTDLRAADIDAGYGTVQILHDVGLAAMRGRVTALVGPNGSGKSTLLKVCANLLDHTGGSVTIRGDDISDLSTRQVATRLALLPQGPTTPPYLTVRDLVEQGRFAHVGPLGMLRRKDHAAVTRAIELVGLLHMVNRDVDTLSGGERQRAWLALALAQETPVLALDEPTTFLDIGHQWEVLELVRTLNTERDLTVVMVLHDLNHAASFSDHLVVLDKGKVVADGPPWDTLTTDLLRDVFGIEASIIPDPKTDRPLIVPHAATARLTDG